MCGAWPRGMRGKEKKMTLFVSCFLKRLLSLSFLSLFPLAENGLVGGGLCFIFFSFSSLVSIFKIALIANLSHIKSCLVVLLKPCASLVVFVDLCEAMLAGHNGVFWLP